MKYFVKSQAHDIALLPVINEEQEGTNTSYSKLSLSTRRLGGGGGGRGGEGTAIWNWCQG